MMEDLKQCSEMIYLVDLPMGVIWVEQEEYDYIVGSVWWNPIPTNTR